MQPSWHLTANLPKRSQPLKLPSSGLSLPLKSSVGTSISPHRMEEAYNHLITSDAFLYRAEK